MKPARGPWEEWRRRRREFELEWAFHKERAARDLEELGLSPSEVSDIVRERFGRNTHARLSAQRAEGADWRGLVRLLTARGALPEAVWIPAVLWLLLAALLLFGPPFSLPWPEARRPWHTVFLAGMLVWPALFAGGCLWTAIARRREFATWPLRLYGLATATPIAYLGAWCWAAGIHSLGRLNWPSAGYREVAWLLWMDLLLILAWIAVSVWRGDLERRCPVCLRRFRMPVEKGQFDSILFDPPGRESICSHGHGKATETRWTHEFQPSRGFWEDLSDSSSEQAQR
jgi:hypothetical protein